MVKVANSLASILQADPPSAEGREHCTLDGFRLPVGAKASATALLLPADLAIEDWVAIGDALQRYEANLPWLLGDWWHFGAHKYGERVKAVAKGVFGFSFGTLANYGHVAGRVKPSLRNEALTFWHHYQVASLEPSDQKRWLKRAARFKWSAMQLRAKIVESKTLPATDADRAQHLARCLQELASQASRVGMLDRFDPAYLSVSELEELIARYGLFEYFVAFLEPRAL